MDRDPATILDIVLACRKLIGFVAGRSRADLDEDLMLQFAVLHAIAIVGEAAQPPVSGISPGSSHHTLGRGHRYAEPDHSRCTTTSSSTSSGTSRRIRFIPCSRNSNPCYPRPRRRLPDGTKEGSDACLSRPRGHSPPATLGFGRWAFLEATDPYDDAAALIRSTRQRADTSRAVGASP